MNSLLNITLADSWSVAVTAFVLIFIVLLLLSGIFSSLKYLPFLKDTPKAAMTQTQVSSAASVSSSASVGQKVSAQDKNAKIAMLIATIEASEHFKKGTPLWVNKIEKIS